MKTLHRTFTPFATATCLLIACGTCLAQSPNRDTKPFAEISFDQQHGFAEIHTASFTQRIRLDDAGHATRIEDLASGKNIEIHRDPFGQPYELKFWSYKTPSKPVLVPMSDDENLEDLLEKWSTAGSGLDAISDFSSLAAKVLVLDAFDTHRNAVMSKSKGSRAISSAFDDLKNAVANQKGVENAFESIGLGLAISGDLGNILLNKDADWKTNTIFGESSEHLFGKLAGKGIERLVIWNADALAARKGLGNLGLFDDVLKLEPKAFGYAAEIRGALASELLGIGYDVLRGKPLNSIDQIENYLDLLTTGIWSAGPASRVFAPYIGDYARFMRELTRSEFETSGRLRGERNAVSVAEQLYQMASMTLHGVDSGGKVIQASIDALNEVPEIAGNAGYIALRQAFKSGDKAAAADALKKLTPVLKRGGFDAGTITAMENALAGGSSPQNSWKDQERELGGVSLRAVPQLDANLGAIEGVTYDKASGQVVLVTDSNHLNVGMRAEDLAAAFAAMIVGRMEGNTRIVGFPEFSLDPAEPTNPDGPWYKAVYIPGFLQGTELGTAMSVADFRLKQLSFGLGVDYLCRLCERDTDNMPGHGVMLLSDKSHVCFTLHVLDPSFPGFKTIPEISRGLSGNGERASRNRLWIVVDRPVPIGVSGGSFVFNEPIHMGVRAKTQGIAKDGKLEDVDDPQSQDPAAQEFARLMTANYDRMAAVEPSFALLKERMVPAVAVVEWIRMNGGTAESLDLDWIKPFLARSNLETSMLAVTRIGFTETTETNKRVPIKGGVAIHTEKTTYSIFGGADLTVEPKPQASRRAENLTVSVRKAMQQKPDAAVFPVSLEGKSYTGVILPMAAEGRKRWSAQPLTAIENGVAYRVEGTGASRHAISSTDSNGTVRNYEWDAAGLSTIRAESADGWVTTSRRPDASGKIVMSLKSPDGVSSELNWSADLQRCTVIRNGKQFVEVQELPGGAGKQPSERISRWTHFPSGTVETIYGDAVGPVRYLREFERDGKKITEEFRLKRTVSGALESIATRDGRTFRLNRATDGRLESASMGAERLGIEYGNADFPELPTAIKAGGFSARFDYDHGLAKTVDLTDGSDTAHADFDAGRLKQITSGSFSAGFEYSNNGILKRTHNSLGTDVTWQPDGRMAEALLPGDVRMVPQYVETGAGKSTLKSLRFFRSIP